MLPGSYDAWILFLIFLFSAAILRLLVKITRNKNDEFMDDLYFCRCETTCAITGPGCDQGGAITARACDRAIGRLSAESSQCHSNMAILSLIVYNFPGRTESLR